MTAPEREYTAEELDAAVAEAAEVEETYDPAAPYGRTLDGRAKKGPGGRPAGKGGRRPGARPGGSSRPLGAAGSRPTAPAPKAKPKPKASAEAPDYHGGLRGWVDVISLPLLFTSPLDAGALMLHGPKFTDAVADLAHERAEVAAVCDKLLKAGPFGGIIAAGLTIGAQLAENHGWLPPEVTTKFGAVPKAQLAAYLQAQYAERQAAEQDDGSV